MSIRDDHDVNRIQLRTENNKRTYVSSNSRLSNSENDLSSENQLVVSSSTLETQGELPKCMYHVMSPTMPASTSVDPRFSSIKPPRVRMILPELNRGTLLFIKTYLFSYQKIIFKTKQKLVNYKYKRINSIYL